jgi:hypothetical protein
MSHHDLEGRKEHELLWTRRRSFLQAAAAWSALGGFATAQAQQRGNIVELRGDALLNGRPLSAQQSIQTGDQVQTGPGSTLVFTVGSSAYHLRQNTHIAIDRGDTLNTVSILRMLTGAVVSVWGRGSHRRIVTPTLTAGIRGTGVYTEVRPQEDFRSYFCNCYGTVELAAGADSTVSRASYHQSFWGEPQPVNGRRLTYARAINHTDEELEFLARLVDQRTAWEVMGRPASKDGGYVDPGQPR